MKDQFLEIKNYIDEICQDCSQENFEYNHFPFIQNILQNFTPKQHDDFVERVFN